MGKFISNLFFIIMLITSSIYSSPWQDMTAGYPVMDSEGYLAMCDGGTGVIYAGSWATGGVYRTVDNGATWNAVSNVINFECLLTDPNTPSTLWGSNWNSGFITDISTDALNPAITWQNRQTGLPLTAVHSISIVGSNSNQLLCSGDSGIFRTTNAGLNWTMVDPSNPASSMNMMETKQSPWNADEYYICGSAGVAVYSWSTDTLTTLSSGGLVMWVSFDCAVPENYYFIKLDGTVYYYNNITGVTSFLSQISGETEATRIENVCCCGSPVIYAAGRNTGVHISLDNGNTWQAYNNGMALVTSVYSFVIDCAEGYIWAGSGTEGSAHGIWRNNICPFTPTNTPAVTATITPTFTCTMVVTPTFTYTCSPTITSTSTCTATPTVIQSAMPLNTGTNTLTYTDTATVTGTMTSTGTYTWTKTPVPSFTSSITNTATVTGTTTCTTTITCTGTITPTYTPYPGGEIYVFPNPFNPGTAAGGVLKIINLPPDSTVQIYTISGELVNFFDEQGSVVKWDGENTERSMASPGIYYYVIKDKNNRLLCKGKIFLIRK